MEIEIQDIHEGDILIGHGLLISPAFLLEKEMSLDPGRLLDIVRADSKSHNPN